ncbi:MAG: 30S ribosomal protein S1 [Gemmatimonadota bacterium]|nr:MAG: 30S ribosomal protein S1 [Gemmatimonadota bacterium]
MFEDTLHVNEASEKDARKEVKTDDAVSEDSGTTVSGDGISADKVPTTDGQEAQRPRRKVQKMTVEEALSEQTAELERTSEQAVPQTARVFLPINVVDEEAPPSEDFHQMLALYENTLKPFEEGEIVKGKILQVDEKEVVVDVGFKSEGAIPLGEFGEPLNIQVGDEIEVFLENIENQDGQVVLSKLKADFMKVWDRIKLAFENEEVVEGKLLRRIKGGIVVDLFGVDAFLPGSQIDIKQVKDFDQYIGHAMAFKIIKLNKTRRNIVISRRVVLEEERARRREQILAELEKDQVREGIVKNITDFGAFIDLGGVDGLLHITDMSWGRVSHPSEMLAIGDKINVKVLDFAENKERISLGLKQLTPYPWENIEEKYPVGNRVRGTVVSIADYGAFVELEKGVEGLIHISEMSWTQHIRHPSKMVAIGDVVETVVLSVDKDGKKISLGLKQIEPDPWEALDEKYPVGSRITGRVRNLTPFGAFVEVEEGIDGLVHISDMSWTKRIRYPSEVMRKGDRVEVVVLKIDKENRRISLGYKQTEEDPWDTLAEDYAQGNEVEGVIAKILEKGLVVNLPKDVEGFVPMSQLNEPIRRMHEVFSEGETIPLKVIKFDRQNRRIVLSVKAYFEDKERNELDDFVKRHPRKAIKVTDHVEKQEVMAAPAKEKETYKEVKTEAETQDADEETGPEGEKQEAARVSGTEATEPKAAVATESRTDSETSPTGQADSPEEQTEARSEVEEPTEDQHKADS